MAQGKSLRNPLAFASVLYPGRYLASQPIPLGFRGGGGTAAQERETKASPPSRRFSLRAGGQPLLDALSIFCMSAAAVAAERGGRPTTSPRCFVHHFFRLRGARGPQSASCHHLVSGRGEHGEGRTVGDGVRFGHEVKLGPTRSMGRAIFHSESAIGIGNCE